LTKKGRAAFWAIFKQTHQVTLVLFQHVLYSQGGQIGRFFSYWVIVYFGRFMKITEVANIFGQFFSG
jgi:hypothetical protein